ncbi:MAG: efflux RND transporter periplasmic adaptor subunit [Planctomycetes bacterium]|nr:efflux RND transporter periplasmic adaptor subunit [Planctomycetota bacterium]
MKKIKRFNGKPVLKIVALLAVLVVMMMWLAGAFRNKIQAAPTQEPVAAATCPTTRVQTRQYPMIVEQAGTVRTRTEAQVSSRLMAQVQEVLVREGDTIHGAGAEGKATILAKLDDRDIQAKLQQAQAQVASLQRALSAALAQEQSAQALLQQAAADLGRFEKLVEAKAATVQQLEHARTQRDTAQAQVLAAQGLVEQTRAQQVGAEAAVREAQVMLSFAVIEAPFDGKISSKKINPGDTVTPGQVLFVVESPSEPQLHAMVSETVALHLKVGQTLPVQIDALQRQFDGVVREVVPQADPLTRTILVKVDLPQDAGLVSGLFGRLRVPIGNYSTLVIAKNAIRQSGQLNLVQVLEKPGLGSGPHVQNSALGVPLPVRRFVQVGPEHGTLVEVLSGVQEGEEVVTN